MPGRYYDVDEEGNIIDPRLMDLSPGEVRPYDRYNDSTNNNEYNRYDRPFSRTPSRSRSRHHSPPKHRESNRRPWVVPVNPLLRAEESDDETKELHGSRHHHRHHHRHHRSERHHHRSRSPSKPRLREFSTKKNTPADLKDRWGHELYIENVRMMMVFDIGCFESRP